MMFIFYSLLTLLSGLILGSFASAVSYRLPRGIGIQKGRSKCDDCEKTISWYDNIPVFSYLWLRGRCRHCHKKISKRYLVIESMMGFSFLLFFFVKSFCSYSALIGKYSSSFCLGYDIMSVSQVFFLSFFLIVIFFSITILVIDFENMIIPDSLVFYLFGITAVFYIVTNFDYFYSYLLTGFLGYMFFLFLHLITKGKGMGLGDAKLALVVGFILGPLQSLDWIFTSFILGGILSVVLLLSKSVKIKSIIPFGPIMIAVFLLEIFFGPIIFSTIGL